MTNTGSTKSLAGSALRSVGIYTFANAFARICSFGALPFLSSHLTPQEYGSIGLLMTSGWVVRAVANMGIISALPLLYYERGERDRRTIIATATVLMVLTSAVLVIATIVAATPLSIAVTGAPGFEGPVIFYVVGIALVAATGAWQLELMLENRAVAYGIASTLGGAVSLIGALPLVIYFGMGVKGWIWATVAGVVLQSVVLFFSVKHEWARLFDWSGAKELLHHGLPLLPVVFLVFALQTTPLYLERALGGVAAAGEFSYALNFALSLQIVASAISAAWLPFFMRYRDRADEGAKTFHAVCMLLFALLGAAVIAVAVGSAWFIHLIATPAMQSAALLVAPLAFAQLWAAVVPIPQPPYYFVRQLHWIPVAQTAGLIVQLVTLAIGHYAFGTTGVAFASGSGCAFTVFLLAAAAAWRGWPGADQGWTQWAGRAGILACLLVAGVALHAFDTPGATLIWAAVATAVWAVLFLDQAPVLKEAFRELRRTQ